MSEPIKAGDLVEVIATSGCAHIDYRGYYKRVERIIPAMELVCEECNASIGRHVHAEFTDEYPAHLPLSWLRRVPPLEELEGEKQDEEITA